MQVNVGDQPSLVRGEYGESKGTGMVTEPSVGLEFQRGYNAKHIPPEIVLHADWCFALRTLQEALEYTKPSPLQGPHMVKP